MMHPDEIEARWQKIRKRRALAESAERKAEVHRQAAATIDDPVEKASQEESAKAELDVAAKFHEEADELERSLPKPD